MEKRQLGDIVIAREESEKEWRSFDYYWRSPGYETQFQPLDALKGHSLWALTGDAYSVRIAAAQKLEAMAKELRGA